MKAQYLYSKGDKDIFRYINKEGKEEFLKIPSFAGLRFKQTKKLN